MVTKMSSTVLLVPVISFPPTELLSSSSFAMGFILYGFDEDVGFAAGGGSVMSSGDSWSSSMNLYMVSVCRMCGLSVCPYVRISLFMPVFDKSMRSAYNRCCTDDPEASDL